MDKNFTRSILSWYEQGHRAFPWRETQDPYRIWVSEIMLQQTRAETVIPYYYRFLHVFPDIVSLACAPEDLLLKQWEGLGYYSRVRNMQKCAKMVCQDFNGQFPHDPEELKLLPGIGDYTAGAIASIAFGKPCAAVDGNVIRVISRYCCIDKDIRLPETKRTISEIAQSFVPEKECERFSNAMMELGACICTPRSPKCECCPVAEQCQGRIRGFTEALPYKSPEKKKKVEEHSILLVFKENRAWLIKGEEALLKGLYTFPNLEGSMTQDDCLQFLSQQNLHAEILPISESARHVFTHKIWNMKIYGFVVKQEDGEGKLWFEADEIEGLPMPTAIKKARQICLTTLLDAVARN